MTNPFAQELERRQANPFKKLLEERQPATKMAALQSQLDEIDAEIKKLKTDETYRNKLNAESFDIGRRIWDLQKQRSPIYQELKQLKIDNVEINPDLEGRSDSYKKGFQEGAQGSYFDSIGSGLGQVGSLGFDDEIIGGLKSVPALFDPARSFTEEYEKNRDQVRGYNKGLAFQNPLATGGSKAAGYVAMAPNVVGQGLLGTAVKGGTYGGLLGAGQSEAETAEGVAKDARDGALFGAAVPVGIRGAGTVMSGAGRIVQLPGQIAQAGFRRIGDSPAIAPITQSMNDKLAAALVHMGRFGKNIENAMADPKRMMNPKSLWDHVGNWLQTEGGAAGLGGRTAMSLVGGSPIVISEYASRIGGAMLRKIGDALRSGQITPQVVQGFVYELKDADDTYSVQMRNQLEQMLKEYKPN